MNLFDDEQLLPGINKIGVFDFIDRENILHCCAVALGNFPERIPRLYHINHRTCHGGGGCFLLRRDILHDFRRFVSQDNGFHGDGGTQFALLLGKHLKIQIIQTQLHSGGIALSHATQLHYLPEGNPAFQHTERCFVILAVIQQADGQNAIGFYGICGGACFGKAHLAPNLLCAEQRLFAFL